MTKAQEAVDGCHEWWIRTSIADRNSDRRRARACRLVRIPSGYAMRAPGTSIKSKCEIWGISPSKAEALHHRMLRMPEAMTLFPRAQRQLYAAYTRCVAGYVYSLFFVWQLFYCQQLAPRKTRPISTCTRITDGICHRKAWPTNFRINTREFRRGGFTTPE